MAALIGVINVILIWLILTIQMAAQVEVIYNYNDIFLNLIEVYPKGFSPKPKLVHSQLLTLTKSTQDILVLNLI